MLLAGDDASPKVCSLSRRLTTQRVPIDEAISEITKAIEDRVG
jgi:hypothetical protein